MERRPDVQDNGGFWSSRRWDLHLRELDRAFKYLAGKNEEFKVRYITEDECWAMREEEKNVSHTPRTVNWLTNRQRIKKL